MVEHSSERLDVILKALSDSTRRKILSRLAKQEANVSELAAPFEMSLAAVSKHLKVLESANFIKKTKEGRNFRCRANLTPLSQVSELLEELGAHWRTQLDSLEEYLTNEKRSLGRKNESAKRK